MGRIFVFVLPLFAVGLLARTIYVNRWEIAEDFIGYAMAAVIAVIVYIVKRLKDSKKPQVKSVAEKIEASYVPIFVSLHVGMIICAAIFFLILLLRWFTD